MEAFDSIVMFGVLVSNGDRARIFLSREFHQIRLFPASLVSLTMALNFISELSCWDWSVSTTEFIKTVSLSAMLRPSQQTLPDLSLRQSVGKKGVVLAVEFFSQLLD